MALNPESNDVWERLISAATSTAVHLEMRDRYTPSDPLFLAWKAGSLDTAEPVDRAWFEEVRWHVARGVAFRRARIVSEPVTDYVRFEYEVTQALNVAAGEQVRWLPRRHASDLCVPGNDFWVFDNRVVRFGYFTGNGEYLGDEEIHDPAVVKLCASAFEAVWERAVPHEAYRPV